MRHLQHDYDTDEEKFNSARDMEKEVSEKWHAILDERHTNNDYIALKKRMDEAHVRIRILKIPQRTV